MIVGCSDLILQSNLIEIILCELKGFFHNGPGGGWLIEASISKPKTLAAKSDLKHKRVSKKGLCVFCEFIVLVHCKPLYSHHCLSDLELVFFVLECCDSSLCYFVERG